MGISESRAAMNDDSLPPVALLEHAGFVRSLASNLLRDDADADDAAQETLARALERPPRPGPGVRGWLAAVLRNVVRMRMRSGSRRARRERATARGESTPAADDAVARQEVLRAVVAAVRGLDAPHREVVMLRHYEDLPPRAIAARLGLPLATVKGRLRRAHERLRERLDERRGGNVEGWRTALGGLAGFDVISHSAATVGGGAGGVAMGTATKLGATVTAAALIGGGGILFGVGYVVGESSATSEAPPAIESGRPIADAPRLAATERPRAESTAAAEGGPSIAERIRRGTPADLYAIRDLKPPAQFDGDAVDALLVRLQACVAAGELGSCNAVVALLGQADDVRGDAALLALMQDETLDLPHPLGSGFGLALRNSPRSEAMATAARRRMERETAAGNSSWTASAGWIDLVAAHGAPADLDWVAGSESAAEALARSGRPEAAERLARMAGTRDREGRYVFEDEAFAHLAAAAPDVAAALVAEHVGEGSNVRGAVTAYARHAPVERLGPVEGWLRSLTSERDRVEAAYAVQALRDRGADVSGLAAHLDAPVLFLERIAAGEALTLENRPLLNAAGYAVEYNRATWSERAARALEAAQARLQRESVTVGGPSYPEVAKIVRAGLASRWK